MRVFNLREWVVKISKNSRNSNSVVCSNIIPHSAKKKVRNFNQQLMKNGLFLANGIEQAFVKLHLTFVEKPIPTANGFVIKMFYVDCRREVGNFDGCVLESKDHEPFKLALYFHAYHTYLKSVEGNVITAPQ